MSQVIAICGMMGSGKSTLVKHLRSALPDCAVLHEDNFNTAPLRSVSEIQDWWERGGHVAEFDLSSLTEQLQAEVSQETGIILLETQFGRLHPMLRPWIDFQCWIDIDSDIAFARKVTQLGHQFLQMPADSSSREALRWIVGFCESYLQTTRQLFHRQRQQVAMQSDISISGTGVPEDVCHRFCRSLPNTFSVTP